MEAIKTAARMSWAAWRGAAKGKRRARGEIRRECRLDESGEDSAGLPHAFEVLSAAPRDAVAKFRRVICIRFLLLLAGQCSDVEGSVSGLSTPANSAAAISASPFLGEVVGRQQT